MAELMHLEGIVANTGATKMPAIRQRFLRILACLLAQHHLPICVFLAAARGLRRLSSVPAGDVARALEAARVDLELMIRLDLKQAAPLLAAIVSSIEQSGATWSSVRPCSMAASTGLSPQQLRRLCGRYLRTTVLQLRRAVVVRQAVVTLATTDDHVDQIAYALGYGHASTLDRDFDRCLGITPTAYRRLVAALLRR